MHIYGGTRWSRYKKKKHSRLSSKTRTTRFVFNIICRFRGNKCWPADTDMTIRTPELIMINNKDKWKPSNYYIIINITLNLKLCHFSWEIIFRERNQYFGVMKIILMCVIFLIRIDYNSLTIVSQKISANSRIIMIFYNDKNDEDNIFLYNFSKYFKHLSNYRCG